MRNSLRDFLQSKRGIAFILIICLVLFFIFNTLLETEVIKLKAEGNSAYSNYVQADSNVWLDSTIRELEWDAPRSIVKEDIKDVNSLISERLGKQFDNASVSGNNVYIILLKAKDKNDLLNAAAEDGYGLDSSAAVVLSDLLYLFDPTDERYEKETPTKGCQLIIAIGYTLFNKEELAELTVRVIKSYFPRQYPRWYYFEKSPEEQKEEHYAKRDIEQLATKN